MTSLMGSGWLTAAPSGLVAWNKFSYLTQFPELYIQSVKVGISNDSNVFPDVFISIQILRLIAGYLSFMNFDLSKRRYLWYRFYKPSIDLANDIQLYIDAFIFNNGTRSLKAIVSTTFFAINYSLLLLLFAYFTCLHMSI